MIETQYQSFEDPPDDRIMTAWWRRFFVVVSGNTDDTHLDVVKMLTDAGHIEVTSPEACDYCLLFCPIISRAGTDVDEAFTRIPESKPTVLVVMHHTWQYDTAVFETRKHMRSPNVHLIVDCVFYRQKLTECAYNNTAWREIREFLHISEQSAVEKVCNYIKKNPGKTILICGVVIVTIILMASFIRPS